MPIFTDGLDALRRMWTERYSNTPTPEPLPGVYIVPTGGIYNVSFGVDRQILTATASGLTWIPTEESRSSYFMDNAFLTQEHYVRAYMAPEKKAHKVWFVRKKA